MEKIQLITPPFFYIKIRIHTDIMYEYRCNTRKVINQLSINKEGIMNQDLHGKTQLDMILAAYNQTNQQLADNNKKIQENEEKQKQNEKEKVEIQDNVQKVTDRLIYSQNFIVDRAKDANDSDVFSRTLKGIAVGVGLGGLIILTGGLGVPAASACIIGLGAVGGAAGAAMAISEQTLYEINKLNTEKQRKEYCDTNKFKVTVLCLSTCIAINGMTLIKLGDVIRGNSDDWLKDKLGSGLKIDINKLSKDDINKFNNFANTVKEFAIRGVQNRNQLLELSRYLEIDDYANLSFSLYDQVIKINKSIELVKDAAYHLLTSKRLLDEQKNLLQVGIVQQNQVVKHTV